MGGTWAIADGILEPVGRQGASKIEEVGTGMRTRIRKSDRDRPSRKNGRHLGVILGPAVRQGVSQIDEVGTGIRPRTRKNDRNRPSRMKLDLFMALYIISGGP